MMIVPIDAEVQEAENVTEQHWNQGRQRSDAVTVWHLHFQHHDSNNDGDHAIKERLHSVLAHN
jgi:predicted metallo-beta-lactamase superfamily hydrolase